MAAAFARAAKESEVRERCARAAKGSAERLHSLVPTERVATFLCAAAKKSSAKESGTFCNSSAAKSSSTLACIIEH
jgi:hypothetical protein